MVSIPEFTAKIKQKYPEYHGVDDYTLATKILEKYPEYRSKVDMQQLANYEGMRRSLFGALPGGDIGAGIAQDTIKTGMNTASILNSPISSTQNLISKYTGMDFGNSAKEKVYEAQKKNLTTAQNTDQAIGQGISSIGAYLLPSGIIGKMSKGVGSLAKGAGYSEGVTKALTGVAGLVGDAATSTAINSIQENKMPTFENFGGNLAFGAGVKGLGWLTKGIGKGFMGQLLGATRNEKALLDKRNIDVYSSLADDIGFAPTKKAMTQKASAAIQKYVPQRTKILKSLDEQASKAGALLGDGKTKLSQNVGRMVKPEELTKKLSPDDIAKEIDDIIGSTTWTGKKKVLQDIDEEISYIKKVIGNKPLTPSRVHELKQIFDKPVNWDKLNPADKAAVAVNKVVADNARGILDKMSGGSITKVNAQIGALATISKLTKKGEYSKTLGDIIAGSGGLGSGGIKGAVVGVGMQRLLRSPAVQSGLGTSGFKLGSFLNSALARKLAMGVGNQSGKTLNITFGK